MQRRNVAKQGPVKAQHELKPASDIRKETFSRRHWCHSPEREQGFITEPKGSQDTTNHRGTEGPREGGGRKKRKPRESQAKANPPLEPKRQPGKGLPIDKRERHPRPAPTGPHPQYLCSIPYPYKEHPKLLNHPNRGYIREERTRHITSSERKHR